MENTLPIAEEQASAVPSAQSKSTSSFWTSPFVTILAFIGLGPKNSNIAAPTDYVQIKARDLLYAVESAADEARVQGKSYVQHVQHVVDTRNRLKQNAIADARHVVSRWETLAEQAADRIAAFPEDQQAEIAKREMQALVTAVEVDFRTLVPEDIALMANQLAAAINAGQGEEAIAALVANVDRVKKKQATTAMRMAGGDAALATAMEAHPA